jgi:site-specific DNA-cytosine methylase
MPRDRIYTTDSVCFTITTNQTQQPHIFDSQKKENDKNGVLSIGKTDYRVRKLTPLEAWRLMGIDDEDFNKAKEAGISDSQLYKQAGNAIVVDVLVHLFKNLF